MAWPALGGCRPWATRRSTPCLDDLRSIVEIFDLDGDSSTHGVDLPAIGTLSRRRPSPRGWGHGVDSFLLLLVGVDLRRHVDPRHAWMLFVHCRNIRFRWRFIHAWRGSTSHRDTVEAATKPAWMGSRRRQFSAAVGRCRPSSTRRSTPCVDALRSIVEIFDFVGDSSTHGVDLPAIGTLSRRRPSPRGWGHGVDSFLLLLVGVDLGRHVDPRHAWMLFVQLSKYSI